MPAETDLARAGRAERARIVAALARRLGDLELAEDAVHDAFAQAAATWPRDGVPDRPGAWLTTVAWRRALDARRRDRPLVAGPAPETEAPVRDPDPDLVAVDDDVLGLILACCHPALALETQVALTLRHVAGLTAREIAAAFLVEEETMAKRLVRARVKLRDAGARFGLPARDALGARLAAVHAVIYLVFTEGHASSGGDAPIRVELCDEAVWLAEQLHALAAGDAETTGLLALLLLTGARAGARQDPSGSLLTFAEQDRERWDERAIARARSLLASTGLAPPGPYQVQAAIAALHCAAPAGGEPDWAAIADLHRVLARLAPSPVVEVNLAMARGRSAGPAAGLAVLAPLLRDRRVARYAPMHAVHADLLERHGDPVAAAAAWQRACDLSVNAAHRSQLAGRAEAALSSAATHVRRQG